MAVAVVGAIGVSVAGLLLLGKSSSPYPKQWDPRIAPLAAEASKLRHLQFRHPVYVEFLTPAAYTRKSGGGEDESSLSSGDKQELADTVAQFRALGLYRGNLDLFRADKTLSDSGTLAFYSSKDKRVYIRGTALSVDLEVTLIHELTHALQDQNFGLDKVYDAERKSKGDPLAARALVEGDAKVVEGEYVASLSSRRRAAYVKAEQSQSSSAGVAKVKQLPKVLIDAFSAPYEFGPGMVKILKASGGQAALDGAFRDPPVSFAEVWNPFAYLAHQQLAVVPRPVLPAGAVKVDDSPMGSFVTFLVLAEREPALQALDAADAWRGDSALVSRKAGKVCVAVRMRGDGTTGDGRLLAAWRRWAHAMPAGVATVTTTLDGDVLVHSCDPGAGARFAVTDAADRALAYPGSRIEAAAAVLADAKRSGSGSGFKVSPQAAYCYADDAIRLIPANVIVDNPSGWQPDVATTRKLQSDLLDCMTAHP